MSINVNDERIPVSAALRKAHGIIGIGDTYGWPRPQAYQEATAMLNAARNALLALPTAAPTPVKPKDVQKWIDSAVEIRLREDVRRQVADELVLTWERNTGLAGLSAISDYSDRLNTLFGELIDKFDSLADAPRTITGHETTEQIESHTAVLRTANELSTALMQRALIADAAQEGDDVGADVIWLILDPQAETTRDGIQDALETFRGRMPQTLAEWDALRPLGLRLARLGEVAVRKERHMNFMFTISMKTPDLGMLDHSYGEIENNPPNSNNARFLIGESDALYR